MDTIFTYVPGDSFLHRMNPLMVFLAGLIVCIAAAVSMNCLFVLALIIVQLIAAASAGVFGKCLKIVLGLGSLHSSCWCYRCCS